MSKTLKDSVTEQVSGGTGKIKDTDDLQKVKAAAAQKSKDANEKNELVKKIEDTIKVNDDSDGDSDGDSDDNGKSEKDKNREEYAKLLEKAKNADIKFDDLDIPTEHSKYQADLIELQKNTDALAAEKEKYSVDYSKVVDGKGTEIDYVSKLTTSDVKKYIALHNLLRGRYLQDDGTVEIATHRMFDLVDNNNFIISDIMQDIVLKTQSEILIDSMLEEGLATSSFESKENREKIKVGIFGLGYSRETSSSDTTETKTSNNDKYASLKVITSDNIIRARINLTEKSIKFNEDYLNDLKKIQQETKNNLNRDYYLSKIWKMFKQKYGEFFITQAYVGGKILIVHETDATTQEEYYTHVLSHILFFQFFVAQNTSLSLSHLSQHHHTPVRTLLSTPPYTSLDTSDKNRQI